MSASAKKESWFSKADSASKPVPEKSSLIRPATCRNWLPRPATSGNTPRKQFLERVHEGHHHVRGEQPGDREDLAGRPFVGPAGKLLDEALAQAGIDRAEVYVTNVVKHFKVGPIRSREEAKFTRSRDIPRFSLCRPWLDAEIRLVRPQILVCLGATAAQTLLGKGFSVSRQRGQLIRPRWLQRWSRRCIRRRFCERGKKEARKSQMQAFVRDLKVIGQLRGRKHRRRFEAHALIGSR